MPPQRVKGPPYLVTLLIAVAVVAIIGFQSLRERRTSNALLEDKDIENNNLHKELEALSETSEEMRQTISNLSIEKDALTLERDTLRKQLIDLEHEKSSTENEKNKLDISLRGKTDEMDDLKLKVHELQLKENELNLLKTQVKNLQKKIKLLETNQAGKISDHGKLASDLDAEQDNMGQGTRNSHRSNMTTMDSTTANFSEKEYKNNLHVRNPDELAKTGQAGDLSHEKKSIDQRNIKNDDAEEGGQERGDNLDHIDPESLDKDIDDNDEEQIADKEEDENEEKEDNARSDEDEEDITDQQDDITEDIKQNIEHGDDNDHDEERVDIE